MNPLPGLFRITCYLLPVTCYLLLVASPASAAAPCANPISTEKLTDNWITANDQGEAPIRQTIPTEGAPGAKVRVELDTVFQVDFSQLQAIFAAPNSDYLEGEFQKDTHASANLQELKPKDLNSYYGPGQKATPKIMTDMLKIEYVKHVNGKPTLPEAENIYTDTQGQNHKTIINLVNTYGIPNPDTRSTNQWSSGWGKYWPKIPTAYNEFYEGQLQFRIAAGQDSLDKIKAGEKCPEEIRTVKFVMPDFFRHAALSGQLNSTLVPKAAQSEEANSPILASENPPKNIVTRLIQKCFEALSDNHLAKTLRKVIKITLENLNPVKDVYAETTCIPITKKAKSGNAPYCALPTAEVQSGDSCQNKDDPYKLDKDNPNVICTFRIVWQSPEMTIGETGENGFDSCADTDDNGEIDTCYLEVRVWPVFRVPWLAEIWNNSLYSDSDESGVGSVQKTGRPGFYPLFTPQSVSDKILPPNAQKLAERCNGGNQSACDTLTSEFADCLNTAGFNKFACLAKLISRKLPGEVKGTQARERFIAAPDCSKDFVKNLALLPRVAQVRRTGINCDSLALAKTSGGPGSPSGGTDSTTLNFYIKYGDTSIKPANREQIITDANNTYPDNNINKICPGNISCWDYVISESAKRGVSPAFAIAVWWEEGGFGGLVDGSRAASEFGCNPTANPDFQESFECFLNFTAAHPYDPNDAENSFFDWMRYFCGPQVDPICSNNPNFINNLKSIYNQVAPGQLVNL